MKNIFDQTTIGNLPIKNRLFRSATWEALTDEQGHIPKELLSVYEELAEGGVGTIITGFTTVSKDDFNFPCMMRIQDDQFNEAYKEMANRVHAFDAKIVMQLAIGEFNKRGLDGFLKPYEINDLTSEDINIIVNLFKEAAARAKKCGFDGVQIHAAHNFFLSRCISPLYNTRDDEYGGTAIKRAKIIADIYKAIRESTGEDFFICMKINCEDFMAVGLTQEDSLEVCKVLGALGIDAIEVSGNYTSRPRINSREKEGYFKDFAIKLKQVVNTPVILVGGHRSVENMNHILNTTDIEYLSLSRPFIRQPNLVNRWKNNDLKPALCISCNTCYRTEGHKCIFNIM